MDQKPSQSSNVVCDNGLDVSLDCQQTASIISVLRAVLQSATRQTTSWLCSLDRAELLLERTFPLFKHRKDARALGEVTVWSGSVYGVCRGSRWDEDRSAAFGAIGQSGRSGNRVIGTNSRMQHVARGSVPDYPITRLPDCLTYPITRLSNCPSRFPGANRLNRTMCQKAATPSFQLIFFPSAYVRPE